MPNPSSLQQDFLAALILCECVYKKIDMSEQELLAMINEFIAPFPPGLFHIDTVQLSHNGVPQRCVPLAVALWRHVDVSDAPSLLECRVAQLHSLLQSYAC